MRASLAEYYLAFVGGIQGLSRTPRSIGSNVAIGSFGYAGSNETSSQFAQKSTIF